MRRANRNDVPLLVGLMAEFYAEAGYALHHERAASAFAAMLADERLGYVWIIQEEHRDIGHIVVALRYAMEYGGLVACLDDLYVKTRLAQQGPQHGCFSGATEILREWWYPSYDG